MAVREPGKVYIPRKAETIHIAYASWTMTLRPGYGMCRDHIADSVITSIVVPPVSTFDPRKDYGSLRVVAQSPDTSTSEFNLGLLMHAYDNPIVRIADTLAQTLAFIEIFNQPHMERSDRARSCIERLQVNLEDLREHAKELGPPVGRRLAHPIAVDGQLEVHIDCVFDEPLMVILSGLRRAAGGQT